MKKILLIIATISAMTAFAKDDNNTTCQGKVLSVEEVKAELGKLGYNDFKDIDYDDCIYDVEAKNKNGDKMELKFDPNSGKIVSEEKKGW